MNGGMEIVMQKNESVTVAIQDIGVNGEGIGRVNGYTLFIKDAVIGDKSKKELRLRKIDEDHYAFRASCRACVQICQKMRRLPDPGDVLRKAAGI